MYNPDSFHVVRAAAIENDVTEGWATNLALGIGVFILALMGPKLGIPVLLIGIVGLGAMAIFQLITLSVEFDASNRAKAILTSTNILTPGEETRGMSKVLDAAALTYVAALVSTIGTLLYYLLIVLTHSNRRD